MFPQGTFTCSKLAIEILERNIKRYSKFQSIIHFWQLNSNADFEQVFQKFVNFNYRPLVRYDSETTPSLTLNVLFHDYYL